MSNFGAVDDSDSVTSDQVERIVRTLCVSYSHVRRSFVRNHGAVNVALKEGDVNEAVLLLARCYRLPGGFLKRIGYSAKMSAPAALQTRVDFFTKRPLSSTLYFQQSKEELCRMPHYMILHIIAHELAHARMAIDAHKLRHSEFATDVLALLVTGTSKGYNEFMTSTFVQHGYIRRELLGEIYHCLSKYSDTIYMK